MACKRTATSDLNHDNWNHDDEPEDAGTFSTASQEILEKRIVRTAKRRLPPVGETTTKSAFSGFSGFKSLSTPTPTTSAFSFLTQTKNSGVSTGQTTNSSLTTLMSNGTSKPFENGTLSGTNINETLPKTLTKCEQILNEKNDTIFKKSSDYFSKLRGLNESVTQWIKTHVESNPFCILTPIFRDYERYLKEIENQRGQESLNTSSIAENKNENVSNVQNNSLKETDDAKSITESKSTSDDIAPNIKSIFDKKTNVEDNPFLTKIKDVKSSDINVTESRSLTFPSTNTPTFSFGQTTNTSATSTGFSFGGAKPFTFGTNAVVSQNSESKSENGDKDGEDDEPPKVEFKPVNEEGSIYEKRCKVFIRKDGVFGDRGVGVLFLKPTPNGKTQLIVRAENSLGNLLLNTLLTKSLPTKRMNEKTVMLVCLPLADSQPPPTPVLLRVKTSEDADSLLEALDNNKK